MKHLSKILIVTLLTSSLLSISMTTSTGQTVNFQADNSLRNNVLGHYYKMVSWNDSQYKEFAYWLQNGSTVVESMNWRAVFPAGYQKTGPTKYPMIVMLHGAGESAREWTGHFVYDPSDLEYDNNGLQLLWGGKEHLDAVNLTPSNVKSFPGIVLFPQAKYNGAWSSSWDNGVLSQNNRMVVTIIEEMIANYSVDEYKIAVHGLSSGGKGTWDIAAKRPDLFAAILPISGVGTDTEVMTDILLTTPIWLFQGGIDTNPSPGAANTWINTLKNKGGNPKLTVYSNLGHSVWNNAYAEADFFPWIKAQDKRNIYVFGGSTKFCAGSGQSIKLGFSAGYLSYQWKRNGSPISGATTRYYTVTQEGTYTVSFTRKTDGVLDESYPTQITVVSASDAPLLSNTGSLKLPIQNIGSMDNIVNLIAPTGYTEYRWFKNDTQIATSTTNIKLIANNTGTDPSLAGTYTVKAVYPSGCLSPASNPVVVSYNDPQPTTPAFNILSRTAPSSTSANITWQDVSGETGYEIWRYRKGDFVSGTPPSGYPLQKFSVIGFVPADGTAFLDTNVRPGASYIYRVRAVFSNGAVFSNAPSPTFLVTPNDTVAPASPGTLAATDVTSTEVTLSWTPSTDNDAVYNYEVYKGGTLIATLVSDVSDADQTDGNPAPTTQYTVTGLSSGATYTFKVRATDYRGTKTVGNFSGFKQITVTTLSNASRVAEFQGLTEEEELAANTRVYPIPFDHKINIEFPKKEGLKTVVLVDLVGLVIKSSRVDSNKAVATIDCWDVPPGNYIMVIGNSRFRMTKK